jgi:hypothetical protein
MTHFPSPDELRALLLVEPEEYTWRQHHAYWPQNFPQDKLVRFHLRELIAPIAHNLMDSTHFTKYVFDDNYFTSYFGSFIDYMLNGYQNGLGLLFWR